MKKRKIKHDDLTHYFMTPHEQLPASYLASCEKFFKSLKSQATSSKQELTSKQDYDNRIIKDES